MQDTSNYTNEFGLNEIFLKDLYEWENDRDRFIFEYKEVYPYYTETIIDKNRFIDGYVDLRGEEYYKVPSIDRWYYDKEKDKVRIKEVEIDYRLNYFLGDARNFLKIIKNITKEHFVYVMVKHLHLHYENTDKGLTNDFIISRCKEVWDYFKVNNDVPVKNKLFKLDIHYWKEKGYNNWLEVCSIVKKLMKSSDFGSLYDLGKTIEENIEIMKSFGVKTKSDTLKKWCIENNLPYTTNAEKKRNERNKVIIEIYNEDKSRSLREIEKLVKERGYKVNKDTLNNVIKDYSIKLKEEEKTTIKIKDIFNSYSLSNDVGSPIGETTLIERSSKEQLLYVS